MLWQQCEHPICLFAFNTERNKLSTILSLSDDGNVDYACSLENHVNSTAQGVEVPLQSLFQRQSI